MFGELLFTSCLPALIALSKYILYPRSRGWETEKRKRECYRYTGIFLQLVFFLFLLLDVFYSGFVNPSLLSFLFHVSAIFVVFKMELDSETGVVLGEVLPQVGIALIYLFLFTSDMTSLAQTLPQIEIWVGVLGVVEFTETFICQLWYASHVREGIKAISTLHALLIWIFFQKELMEKHFCIWGISFGMVIWCCCEFWGPPKKSLESLKRILGNPKTPQQKV